MCITGPRQRGFTLIEVLLVVLLVGIVSGLVLLAATPADASRIVVGEADRLEESLSLALDAAISDNEQYGLLVGEHGYRFLLWDEATRQWLPSPNPAFQPYELPAEISVQVIRDERKPTLAMPVPATDKPRKDAPQPQLLLLASGETSVIRLEVHAENTPAQILEVDDLGNITRNDTTACEKPPCTP